MTSRARQALERDPVRHRQHPTPAPPRGWVRAIRDALGTTTREFAARLGATSSYVSTLEANQASAAITLSTLQRAGAALGCRAEYVLVPDRPLDDIVMEQARRKAREILAPVGHTMALEDQDVDPDEDLETLARDLVDRRGLWS